MKIAMIIFPTSLGAHMVALGGHGMHTHSGRMHDASLWRVEHQAMAWEDHSRDGVLEVRGFTIGTESAET